jgi:hypothetical protein
MECGWTPEAAIQSPTESYHLNPELESLGYHPVRAGGVAAAATSYY